MRFRPLNMALGSRARSGVPPVQPQNAAATSTQKPSAPKPSSKKGSGLWGFAKGAGKLGLMGLGGYGGYHLYKALTDSEMKRARDVYDDQSLLSLLEGGVSETMDEGSVASMLGFDSSMLEGAMDYAPGRSVRVRPSSDFQSLISESDLQRLQQLRMRQQRTKSEILADLGVFDEGMGI